MNDQPAWLKDVALQQFFAAAKKHGGELRAVGGAVRDHVRGVANADVDFATSLLPDTVMALAAGQGWKAVATGIDHGTVTVVIDGKGYEVTTLRRDVATDGRRATIAYTDDWKQDAARRDFTINALFMDSAGSITDFFGGQNDIAQQKLRFIGDSDARIEEDGLRILRYFRFIAQLGWQAQDTPVQACKRHGTMIQALSGERIRQEMKKLLAANDPQHALQQMIAIGLLPVLLGTEASFPWLQKMLRLEAQHHIAANPWARLMLLVPATQRSAVVQHVTERWRLSNEERKQLQFFAGADLSWKEWLRRENLELVKPKLAMVVAQGSVEEDSFARLDGWAVVEFPVSAKDLMNRGMKEGPDLGKKLKELEQRWIDSDYTLTKKELLN
jgi:poly(A) polymerase